ncbi:unnamed protein product [Acanthoscelides obtectus]|uniref:Uncharacterized protein n=1 Tax=Acanthoscelides obtectus TaxID=200917 RepID=A0A9P0L130_ACAOB|nr:unnamed protein product [Acanthoscelides obtectus]CAH2012475.1 unnamed protein product [Acanthoscelides obtectus]CAK1627204.1 hypothetical protein AOBTE_LOCUS4387 [Acanthoscelides obtectus]CAK1650909.1 hypothetical protein AOBTE_LOCUS16965 [Acanthoscelides obtectus]
MELPRAHEVKSKRYYYDSSDSESGDVMDSDDSIKDKDYVESETSSDSSEVSTDEGDPNNNDAGTATDAPLTSTTSRGSLPSPEKSKPSRWKRPRREWRKKEKNKIRRNLGHSYKNHKGIEVTARELGPPCTCKNKCREKLGEKELDIFKSFWDLGDYDKQNIYLYSCMEAIPKKRSYPKKTKKQVSSRNISIEYFVKLNGENVRLCKKEFLSVHGLQHSKKRIEILYKKMSNEGSITPKKDKRGKHKNRPNRTPAENLQSARDHINAIPKYTSHYSRKKNPGKVYINHDLNISKLYKDYYIDWCKERDLVHVSEDRYRRIFCTEYNIGFKLPKSDTCKTCDMLKIKIEDPGATTEEIKSDKIKLELHQRRAEAMQQSLKRETEYAKISGDTYVITFDLQQALPVPNLTVGPAFYLRKAWVYNLGIHDCVTGQGYMYMWPENVAKRGSDEIASILYKHFREHSIKGNKKLIVYTDNCGGQNKN